MKKLAILFLFLILPLAFSQSRDLQISSFTLSQSLVSIILSVGIILFFILVLLWLGGVLKFGRTRAPWGLILFIIFLISLIAIPYFVPYPQILEVPESWKYQELPEIVKKIFVYLGVPKEWAYLPAIIYLFIIPFAAIYTITWAFLTNLKIFGDSKQAMNAYKVLAFLIAFSTLPLGYFVRIVQVLFAINGIVGIVVFSAVFILGVLFRGYGRVSTEYYKTALEKMATKAKNAGAMIREIKSRLDRNELTEEQLKDELVGFYHQFKDIPEVAQTLQSPGNIRSANLDQLKNMVNQLVDQLPK